MTTSLRDHLQAIHDQRGALTPPLVVAEATDPDHPLHHRFEWDDTIAGHKYRLHQAHRLISVVRLAYTDSKGEPRTIRGFHAVRGDTGHTYEPAEMVAADPMLTQIVLMDMRREWKALQGRYAQFKEFTDMIRRDLEDGAA